VDVDPVVGEQVLAVDHERDCEEVAVAEALGGVDHRGARGRVGQAGDVAEGQRGDDMRRAQRLAAGHDLHHAVAVEANLLDGRVEAHLAAELLDLARHGVPHLPRPVARVVELGDQALDLIPLVAEERGLGGAEE